MFQGGPASAPAAKRYVGADERETKSIMERISSSLTFFYKYVFTFSWSFAFGLATLSMFLSKNEESNAQAIPFGVAWLIGSGFLSRFCAPRKRVEIGTNTILVSNYRRSATVPGSAIVSVRQNRFLNIRPITLWFNTDTPFGRHVTFMPKATFRLFFEDPVVQRLRDMAKVNATA